MSPLEQAEAIAELTGVVGDLDDRLRQAEAGQAALYSLVTSALEYAGLPVEVPARVGLAVVR
ncbi:MAG: hypothetical protein JWO67_4078 [Streptosporangiaceae bacterium]|nr:hypothetical protein [Streptosporangiaceae bacterium]